MLTMVMGIRAISASNIALPNELRRGGTDGLVMLTELRLGGTGGAFML